MLTVSCFCVVWNYLRLRQLPNVNPPQLHSVWFIAHDDPADINLSRTFYKLAPTHGTRHCGLGVRCDGAPSFAASALTAAPVASAASPPIGTSAHVVVSRFRPSTSKLVDCLCITRKANADWCASHTACTCTHSCQGALTMQCARPRSGQTRQPRQTGNLGSRRTNQPIRSVALYCDCFHWQYTASYM